MYNTMEYAEIRCWMEKQREYLAKSLGRLVEVPSVKSEPRPGAPFGESCARALRTAQSLYEESGFETRLYADSGYLLSTVGAGERCIGVFAHSDVVPAGNGWMYTEPFHMLEKDGFFLGRGVSDNKGAIVTSLLTARAIRELKIPLRSRVQFFTGSEEEEGMRDICAFRAEQPMPEVSLVPDSGFPVFRGEKGILRFWLVSNRRLQCLKSLFGGEAYNMVLSRVEADVNAVPGEAPGLAVRSCEGGAHVTATGVARHAAHPEDSVNAMLLLIRALLGTEGVSEEDRETLSSAERFLADYCGFGFGIENDDPDFGKLTCANGMARLEDGRLALSFDVRYGTSVDDAQMLAKIQSAAREQGWEYRLHENKAGYSKPADDPFVLALEEVYAQCTGSGDVHSQLQSGGTYGRYLERSYGIGDSTPHPCPFALPVGHGGAHQPDEVVSIEGLLDAAAIQLCMIIRLDSML